MNFNNTWRNYVNKPTKSKGQLLGEQIFREYKLLAEGKKDDAKKIAPITAHFGTVDLIANQLRTMLGDKGVGKYIVFAAREMEPVYQNNYVPYTKEDGTTGYTERPNREFRYMTGHLEQIMTAIREFHASQNRLEQRDINKYTLRSLRRTLDNLPDSETERKRKLRDKSEAEKNSELVYNVNGIMAVRPLTTQASCYFGHNPRLTTWCISTKSKRNYFDQYTKEEGKAFVIVRFFGIPEDDPEHIISMQWSGPGEPEFEMYFDAPNEAQNPDDLLKVVRKHVEGMFPDDEERWEDLTQELHDALYDAAREVVFDNPPDDPGDMTEQKCQRIEDEFDEKSQFTNLHWQVDQDTFQTEGYVSVFYGARTIIQLDPEHHGIPKDVISKADYQTWRSLERKLEMFSERAGLYQFEDYNLYSESGFPSGVVMLELKHVAGNETAGFTLEGFEEFANDTLAIEREDAMMTRKIAIGLLQDEFSGEDQGLPAEDEQGLDNEIDENMFYKDLERQLLGEEKGRSRQRGIYKFHCMITYNITSTSDKSRGLDDILADMRALPNVTIVTVAIKNQKVAEGRYIAGLAIKFIPSTPGDMNQPELTKARIVKDIKRLENVQSLFKLSAGLIRLE
jgi:hypothetical protein